MNTKIIVSPVPRTSVQKRHLTPVRVWDPQRKEMIETGQTSGRLKARDADETLGFLRDSKTNRFKTGLDELVPNPFLNLTPLEVKGRYSLSNEWMPYLTELLAQDKITRQTWYEILDGVDPDYYTSAIPMAARTDRVMRFEFDHPKTFIEKFSISLQDGTNSFHSSTSRGRMAIQVLLNHPLVARNASVRNSNYHNWYIAEENEEELDRVKIDKIENAAIVAFYELSNNYPNFKKVEVAIVLGLINQIETAPTIVDDRFNRMLKSKAPDKEAKIARFMDKFELMKGNYLRFLCEYMVAQGHNSGLLKTDAGYLYWTTKAGMTEVYRWRNEESLINYLEGEGESYSPDRMNDSNGFAWFMADLKERGITINYLDEH